MKKLTLDVERITHRDSRVMNNYLNEISKFDYEPLSVEEETELAYRIINYNDEKARNLLVQHNLRFVISVSKTYYGENIDLTDIINEGNIGLIKATQSFDPSRGFRFITYAVWWIRKSIINFLSTKGKHIRIPANKSYVINKIKDDYIALHQKLGRTPTENDIIAQMSGDYRISDIVLFYNYYLNNIDRLDDNIDSDDNNSTTKSDQVVNNIFPNSDYYTDQDDSHHRLTTYLNILRPVHREVIVKLFGLKGKEAMSMEAVAEDICISKERVRQLKNESLELLRSKLTN